MKTTPKERTEIHHRLSALGFSYEQAAQLGRIASVLRNWFELECGTDGHNGSTHSIEREGGTDDGKPFHRIQYQSATQGWIDNRYPIPDREKGARIRLGKLMESFPELTYYIQGDCRGPSVFILKRSDVNGCKLDQVYTRGIAVY